MNRGVPPTALKARTGEFTPPGVTRWARSNHAAELCVGRALGRSAGSGTTAFFPTGGQVDEPPVDTVWRNRLKS